MISHVYNTSNSFRGITNTNSNRQSGGAQFQQMFAAQMQQDRFGLNNEVTQQTAKQDYIEIGGADIATMQKFWNGLNQAADGSAELTEEEIAALKEKYDMDHLDANQRYALLLELNQKNVLSYTECVRPNVIAMEFLPGMEKGFVEEIRKMPGYEDFELSAENIARDLKITLPPIYHQQPQNIYEEYQNSAMEWRAKYNAMLKQYGEDRVEYLERAEAYEKIANIFKSLME